ncbi:hypothetical protein ATP_00299 [Candidatus Phytoplasma mali]|uniref:Protein-export membrane protein SecG n=1 Tax=Phytoplasma mali (strain AT) TaxID=482235 RepID=B3QZU9_PHYMT|nr:hypothetical protein [Candidatus Phytoplasma mali]CAP18486.1 hypothetical protein ATP_00299 [Candidatus Phytoplasma mali]
MNLEYLSQCILILFNFLIIFSVILFSDDNNINSYSGSYSEKDKNRKIQGAELFLNRLLFFLITFYFSYIIFLCYLPNTK